VSEEECILKRVCLYVWFYSSSDCILKCVRGGVETQCRVIPKIKRQPLNEAGEGRLFGAGIRCWALTLFFLRPREDGHPA